jgi:hypothetical protein
MFGVAAGFIWAFVPGTLSELFQSNGETLAVLVAGAIAGVVTSVTLSKVVGKSPKLATFCLGLLSLPFGAFLFGVSISVSHLTANVVTGINYRFLEHGFHPVQIGLQYAFYSIFSAVVLGLLPLAVFTTFLLRAVVCWRVRSESGV